MQWCSPKEEHDNTEEDEEDVEDEEMLDEDDEEWTGPDVRDIFIF